MTNRRTKLDILKTPGLKAFSIYCGSAWLALACGNVDNEAQPAEELPEPPVVTRNDCNVNPYFAECTPLAPPEEGMDTEPPPPPKKSAAELARDQAQNVLLANCGGCHGTQLTALTAESGMNYINDMAKLAENGKIEPLNSAASLVIQRMRDGSMPPGGARVSDADIEVVANYIDEPEYWPEVSQGICENKAVGFDELYEIVSGDLRREDAEDRPFLRYISLGNRVTAGVCTDTALDRDRNALVKMMNMLSVNANVGRPRPVDPDQTMYRIDLRDYDWNRSVTVEGVPFDDVWEAIIDANEYAVPFVGEEADDAREDALTAVPFMFLDSMLDVATIGNLYYSVIGVDVTQSLDTFVLDQLGIDVAANLENEDLIRAGTTQSRISRQDRVIEGHEIERRQGVYYQSFDFNDEQNESIFQDPFGFSEGGREAIFTLPNGMLAYLIANADGNLVEDSDILLDARQGNYRAVTAVSCGGCHGTGLIPVVDEVREIVIDTALQLIQGGTLDRDQLEILEKVYLPPAEFARRVLEDSERFYISALNRAGLPTRGVEPVASVFFRFDRDVTLRDAAGDLGLSTADLDDELNSLDPRLGVLEKGSIDRDDFTAVYVASLCALSGVLNNQPEDAICDAALAGLED